MGLEVSAGTREWQPHAARVALMLWDGDMGGTEVLYAGLAACMRELGLDARLAFVTHTGPLTALLEQLDVPYDVLGLTHGRDVLRHPRAFAEAVARTGRDGVILPERGFIGAALRAGGYRPPIVAAEHGALLLHDGTLRGRVRQALNTLAGAWADDIEVGVSDFMVRRMRRAPHARQLRRIYNGIDPERFAPIPREAGPELVVGFAARLIAGKGADDTLRALALARERAPLRGRIAGDGPERPRLTALARELGLHECVEFLGLVGDMPSFWPACDIAAFPSHQFIESFGMAALEAMACGLPVVATSNGAAPELVADGLTGVVVSPGDVPALAEALVAYAQSPELRETHGGAGRARVLERFQIETCARGYLDALGIAGAAHGGVAPNSSASSAVSAS